MKLLIAEDHKDISRALVMLLEKQGYSADAVWNGKDALDYAQLGNYDGIILDIMMSGMDGIEVLKCLRQKKITTPVLMLTAKGELNDRVAGLDAGADDYLPKPFAAAELLSRIRAMLRRRSDYQPDFLEVKGVLLNKGSLELSFGEQKVRLVNREFQVLELLMENIGQIITTDHFMEHIWGWDAPVEVNVVWVTISNLRKKIAALNAPLQIRAVRGIGYRLEEQV